MKKEIKIIIINLLMAAALFAVVSHLTRDFLRPEPPDEHICSLRTVQCSGEPVNRTVLAPVVVLESLPVAETVDIPPKPVQRHTEPPQYQKDAIAKLCQERFNGPMQEQCYHDMLAIVWVESRWQENQVGDGGASFGSFQIYTTVHKHISPKMANDFNFSSKWTLDRMQTHGYPKYRTWALGSHNSLTPEINARYSGWVKNKSAQLKAQNI